MAKKPPSLNGDRDGSGRFRPGNRLGRGNPLSKEVNLLRVALVRSVTVKDIQQIATALKKRARSGDVQAARLILDRVLGAVEALDLLGEIEAMKSQLEALENGYQANGQKQYR